MKILNLYCGIGGNRKLWGDSYKITAVEINPEIAKIYQDFFPNDKVIVGDAHEYLLNHYKEFDFIWSSPPCPSHSRFQISMKTKRKMVYPDMRLYQEIVFLEAYFEGKYIVENVIPFYKPLVRPRVEIQRHYFWSNFYIKKIGGEKEIVIRDVKSGDTVYGFNLNKYIGIDKVKALRNMVNPNVANYIFTTAMNIQEPIQERLFEVVT